MLRRLYGAVPTIDIEEQFAIIEVRAPMTFDWVALDEGVRDNNLRLKTLRLRVAAAVTDGRVTMPQTGQTWRIREGEAGTGEIRTLRFVDFRDPEATKVVIEE